MIFDDLRAYLLTPPSSDNSSPQADALRTIQDILSSRLYPEIVDEGAPLPAAAYSMPDDRQGHLLSGENDGLNDTRIQIDVYAMSSTERETLGKAFSVALDGFIGVMGSSPVALIVRDNAINAFEPDRRQYRKIIDYKVHYEDT